MGDWNPQISESVGNIPFGVSIGDVNNDGQNDLVVGNALDNNISIFMWARIEKPALDVISPNPSGKKINLNWGGVDAPLFYIYREQQNITNPKK